MDNLLYYFKHSSGCVNLESATFDIAKYLVIFGDVNLDDLMRKHHHEHKKRYGVWDF